MVTYLEAGPATVRVVGPDARRASPSEPRNLTDTALGGIDDRFVLLDERPVGVVEVWQALISAVVPSGTGRLVVVHPSWWPRRRVDVVVRAAKAVRGGQDVCAVPRRALVATHDPAAVVVEVCADVVAISSAVEVTAFVPADVSGVIGAVRRWAAQGSAVIIDEPVEGAGAATFLRGTAAQIEIGLQALGILTRRADLYLQPPTRPTPCAVRRPGPPRRRTPAVAAVVAAVALAMIAAALVMRPGRPREFVGLEEGRVALNVPADWLVERITEGPGSRRVQVSSDTDSDVALHITQTYAPGTTLAEAAAVLGAAVDAQAPGIFVDFRPRDDVVGRAAVTYRENRPGRVVRWTVVLAGATRISIGCQAAAGREADVVGACSEAIRSAREVPAQ